MVTQLKTALSLASMHLSALAQKVVLRGNLLAFNSKKGNIELTTFQMFLIESTIQIMSQEDAFKNPYTPAFRLFTMDNMCIGFSERALL